MVGFEQMDSAKNHPERVLPAIPYKSAKPLEDRVRDIEQEILRLKMLLTGAVAMILGLCGVIAYRFWSKQW